MNFKKYHVSKNLFDKNSADIYNSTIIVPADNQWIAYTGAGRTVRIPCEQNTTYAISIKSIIETSIFRVILIMSDSVPVIGSPLYGTIAISSSSDNTAVFTTRANTKYIVVQFSGSAFDAAIDSLMLVAGSHPLPYEPYDSGVWHDVPYYIHKTDTDTITTLPADVYANDNNATVGLKGDMSQTGTPTSTTPIQPQSCGERTGNLFDKNRTTGITNNSYINQSGQIASSSNYYISYPIPVNVGETYTWSFNSAAYAEHTSPTVGFYDNDDNLISVATHSSGIYHFTFTVPSNTSYIKASVYKAQGYFEPMLLSGNSSIDDKKPIPYIPYGYKIPISSADTTTPVYLGEVQSTRRIKKLALTGEENWYIEGSDIFYSDIMTDAYRAIPVCTHFKGVSSLASNNDITISATLRINILTSYVTHTVNDFKTYLQQQYSAGTPVCVWYVLATPQTAVVNEPLRKIGTYADEVSGISIPVTAGANTLSIGTTLQPSEVSVNYKGWHPVVDVHEYEDGNDNYIPDLNTLTTTVSNCVIESVSNNTLVLSGNGYIGSSFSQIISNDVMIPSNLIGKTVTLSGSITWSSEGNIAPRVTIMMHRSGGTDYNVSIYQGAFTQTFEVPSDATSYALLFRIDQNRSEYVGTARVTYTNIELKEQPHWN